MKGKTKIGLGVGACLCVAAAVTAYVLWFSGHLKSWYPSDADDWDDDDDFDDFFDDEIYSEV